MKRLDTFTCYFLDSETDKQFQSLEEARQAAIKYCGNDRCVQPFPREQTLLFGPGDGTTSVMIRQDVDYTQ